MASNQDVAQNETSDTAPDTSRQAETVMRPAVDIFEDAEGISLVADMPGVAKERLNIQVDNDTLTLEGDAQVDMLEGMTAMYADVRSTRYRRSFTLSSELATDEIVASLENGVLNVHIPKRAEARPRKIEVRTT